MEKIIVKIYKTSNPKSYHTKCFLDRRDWQTKASIKLYRGGERVAIIRTTQTTFSYKLEDNYSQQEFLSELAGLGIPVNSLTDAMTVETHGCDKYPEEGSQLYGFGYEPIKYPRQRVSLKLCEQRRT